MRQPRVSLRDVAKAVGKSHATVSMALRGLSNISPSTTAEIRRVAEEMGYQPDPMLSALAEHRKSRRDTRYQATLAWINNFPTREYPERFQQFRLYREGAIEQAKKLGYVLEEFTPVSMGLNLHGYARS